MVRCRIIVEYKHQMNQFHKQVTANNQTNTPTTIIGEQGNYEVIIQWFLLITF